MKQSDTLILSTCYHCGNECIDNEHVVDDKQFCCAGCKSVYQILSTNNLCNYYKYNSNPGQRQKVFSSHYEYLDEPSIVSQLIDYTDQERTSVTFYIPAIHCSSCIWLLEHLHKLNQAVLSSRIDFLKKEVNITFIHQNLSLRQLVELLVSLSYEPLISLQDVVKEKKNSVNRVLIKKIAVAGFIMGNVMLFSFPAYFGLSSFEQQFKYLFGWLNLAFSIPVTFYCGWDFFTSAYAGLKNKNVNLDAPLALIIAVLFLRTSFEVLTQSGPGFADTLSGLVFLLLLGRWLKQRTYYHLSFERDYRSYFPVAVTLLVEGAQKPVAIEKLAIGDRIVLRNQEILPADAILMKGEGHFDFSFVTGEVKPVSKVLGEVIYAGGRQLGEALELEVIKPVAQSYLTRLWNNENAEKTENKMQNFNDSIARYFSVVVFSLAFGAMTYWLFAGNTGRAWAAFTAVIIVACPCVLALSTPFTLSAVLGLFDRHNFYLKNTDVVEQLAKIQSIVFDKTGTITSPKAANLTFNGALSETEKVQVASLARNSLHPLSREIIKFLKTSQFESVQSFQEVVGKGISGGVLGDDIKLGSSTWISSDNLVQEDSSTVHVQINGVYKGYFKLQQEWRENLRALLKTLRTSFSLHLISGDNDKDAAELSGIFPPKSPLKFKQQPHDKQQYIHELRLSGERVMMLGDGLNDAAALRASDLGVAVSDDINNFSPACDAILAGESLQKMPQFIAQAKNAISTIKYSFAIAIFYNLIGLYFAVQGTLSPLTAAVLMPISTITIITFTSVATRYFALKNKLR
ncbi:MAG: heavy metal translocating P-type ATPase [Sphingobacteriaceae bacterium]